MVGAIEPIEGDAVFVADLLRRVDGQCSRSGFVLAISAAPAAKLSARGKNCLPLASKAICCCNRLKAARMPPPVRRSVLCETDYVLVRGYQDTIRLQHAISPGRATCSRCLAMTLAGICAFGAATVRTSSLDPRDGQ